MISTTVGNQADDTATSYSEDASGQRNRKWAWLAALLIAVLGATLWLTFAWLKQDPISILPTDISEPGSDPSSQVTIPSNAPPTQIDTNVQTTEPVATVQPPPILSPETPPVDDSLPLPDSELTPEFIPNVPPPSSESRRSPATPEQTRPTRTVAPRIPAPQSPRRGTIDDPAQPGGDRSSPGGAGDRDSDAPRRGSTGP